MVDDVLIIGAGASGLTAAYDLHWTDYSVKILEASNVIGGRLRKNDEFTDVPLDLGGEWLHVDPSILDEISSSEDEWYFETILQEEHKFKDSTWFDFFNEWIAVDVNPFIEFGCQVTELRWNQNPIQAVCANGDVHEAWHVIVTTPLSVLRRGDINFQPALPWYLNRAVKSAGNQRNFANVIKTYLKFSEEFWTIPSFMLEEDYQRLGEKFFYEPGRNKDTDEHVLCVYNEGSTTNEYAGGVTDEAMIEDMLNDLALMWGSVVRESFTGETLVQNWGRDPYIGGAYSMYHDSYWPLWVLRMSFGGQRLWFAGEAIPRRDWEHGYAHGAALSGRDTAAEIMDIYGDRRRHLENSKLRG